MPSSLADLIIDNLRTTNGRRVEKPWGHEVIFDNDEFMLKLIHVKAGAATSKQVHKHKREVTMIVDGFGLHGQRRIYDENDRSRPVMHSGPLVVEPGTVHRVFGPVTMIEVTTPKGDTDIVRLADSFGREGT